MGLGLLALFNHIVMANQPVFGYLAVLIALAMLVAAFFGGRSAKTQGGHPGWFGARIGAVFGILEGLGAFFTRTTASALRSEVGHTMPARQLALLVRVANSPFAHVLAVATAVVTFALLALIVGSLGGLYAPKSRDIDPV
jgi:hypothetical protein